MPRRDIYHNAVRNALIRDDWTITHDPYTFSIGIKRLFADLGAEQLISAEKGVVKIAVEIKSFVSESDILDLERALGQYVLYTKLLVSQEPNRQLYIAVNLSAYESVFRTELGELLLGDETIRLLVFDEETEVIERWLPTLTISS